MNDAIKRLEKFVAATVDDRKPWDGVYQEIADYMAPMRSAFTTEIAAGDTGMRNVFEDEAIWASEQFSLGVHSMNNSPLSRWFTLEVDGEIEESQAEDVLRWQEEATRWCYKQFNAPRGSFHPMTGAVYMDLGLFGYGVGFGEWCPEEKGMMFQSLFSGECYIIEDKYGRAEGLLRKYKESNAIILDRYGDELSAEVKHRLGKTPSEKQEICHVILPKTHPAAADWAKEVKSVHKYVSVRLCPNVKKDAPLKVGGFKRKPVYVARWGKRSGHVYPTSPGQTALPSVRRNNAAQRDLTIIVNRLAEPPTQGPDDEFLSPYDISPGAKNYYRPGSNDRIEIIGGALGDINPALTWLQQGKFSIQRAFFTDAFLTTNDSNGQNVKATFVMQRRNERFRQLAAMLVRAEREYNSAVVLHTLEEGIDRGYIPAPPVGNEVAVRYVSPIARAQRGEVVDGLLQTLETLLPFAQDDPGAMKVFDKYEIAQFVGRDVNALPPQLLLSREVFEQQQQQDAEQQQAQDALAESQAAKNYAGAVKDVSETTQAGLF